MGFWSKLLGLEPRAMPFTVTDENFEREILRSPLPVVLDAWGPGCMPCKQLEPIMLSLLDRYDGKVRVAEMNVAAAPRTAKRLGVRATPTVLYFKDAREVERVVGLRGELWHQQTVDEILLG